MFSDNVCTNVCANICSVAESDIVIRRQMTTQCSKGAHQMRKVGIRDVAKASGVSISTVSRAFTRPELVSNETRRKILATADSLDFNISRSATALKSGRTYRVAMLMNEEITSWFNTEVFAGIDSVMHKAGYDVDFFEHIDTAETRGEFFTTLPIRCNVDAVFVASFGIDPHEAKRLRRIHVPIVGINTPSTKSFDASISIDDERGMYTATRHLIELGRRHLVYACSDPAPTIDSSIDCRTAGFVRACKEAATTRDIEWEVLSVPRGRAFADNALSALLKLRNFPDAICCQIDMMAIPLMIKLAGQGHVCPRDYSLMGFDDSPYADTVGLTTMRQEPHLMGSKAAIKALSLIEGHMPQHVHERIEPELVLRRSDVLRATEDRIQIDAMTTQASIMAG